LAKVHGAADLLAGAILTGPSVPSGAHTRHQLPMTLDAVFEHPVNSLRRRSRRRAKRVGHRCQPALRPVGHRQAPAALRPAALQHQAAVLRLHPDAEAVRLGTAAGVGWNVRFPLAIVYVVPETTQCSVGSRIVSTHHPLGGACKQRISLGKGDRAARGRDPVCYSLPLGGSRHG
jgi:hypothetical protein